jgi:hypothetical protein
MNDFREGRPKGFDPVNDSADFVLDGLGFLVEQVSLEVALELVFGLLELL